MYAHAPRETRKERSVFLVILADLKTAIILNCIGFVYTKVSYSEKIIQFPLLLIFQKLSYSEKVGEDKIMADWSL